MWMTPKWLERNRIWLPCGRNWLKTLIITNQHHFFTTNAWHALNVNAKRMTFSMMNTEKCSNREFLLEPRGDQPHAKTGAWSYDLQGHAQKKCVECCEQANKKTEHLYKVSNPCLDDHHFKKEELQSDGEVSQLCSQIVLECLYLARIGGLDILWSVNNLTRAVTKWTQACDRRFARWISYIHHTSDFRQYCHVGNTAQHWPNLMNFSLAGFKKLPSQEVIDPNSREIKVWTSMVSQPAPGNSLWGPPTKKWVLKRGNTATLRPQTSGNRAKRRTFCGECVAQVSVTLLVFTPKWFLIALLLDWESLEMCLMMYCVFLE